MNTDNKSTYRDDPPGVLERAGARLDSLLARWNGRMARFVCRFLRRQATAGLDKAATALLQLQPCETKDVTHLTHLVQLLRWCSVRLVRQDDEIDLEPESCPCLLVPYEGAKLIDLLTRANVAVWKRAEELDLRTDPPAKAEDIREALQLVQDLREQAYYWRFKTSSPALRSTPRVERWRGRNLP